MTQKLQLWQYKVINKLLSQLDAEAQMDVWNYILSKCKDKGIDVSQYEARAEQQMQVDESFSKRLSNLEEAVSDLISDLKLIKKKLLTEEVKDDNKS